MLNNLKVLHGHKIREVTTTLGDIRAAITGTGIFTKDTESLENEPLPLKDVLENEMVATVWDEKYSVGQIIRKIGEDIGQNKVHGKG